MDNTLVNANDISNNTTVISHWKNIQNRGIASNKSNIGQISLGLATNTVNKQQIFQQYITIYILHQNNKLPIKCNKCFICCCHSSPPKYVLLKIVYLLSHLKCHHLQRWLVARIFFQTACIWGPCEYSEAYTWAKILHK